MQASVLGPQSVDGVRGGSALARAQSAAAFIGNTLCPPYKFAASIFH